MEWICGEILLKKARVECNDDWGRRNSRESSPKEDMIVTHLPPLKDFMCAATFLVLFNVLDVDPEVVLSGLN